MHKMYRHGEPLERDLKGTRLPTREIGFWHLGQSGVVVRGNGGLGESVVIDPYLTQSIEQADPDNEFVRAFAPPIEPEALAGIGAVLVTHHHGDHLDLPTLVRLHAVSKTTRFVVPVPHIPVLIEGGVSEEVIVPASAMEEIHLPQVPMGILPIAAAHTEYETDDTGHHLYLGYVLNVDGVSVYHSGDTVVTNDLLQTLETIRPAVALLPINGLDYMRTSRGILGNMSARDAVDLAAHLGVRCLLPNHYDLFPNNRDNPAFFVDYLFHHYPSLPFHMMAVGERFVYHTDSK